MNATDYVIETHGLTKTYKGVQALKSLDLSVAQNSICGFLGPNGAGKTTTLRVLTSFHPATTGQAVVAGHDVVEDPIGVRRSVGYLPENVPIYTDLRVEEYLHYRARLKGVARARRTLISSRRCCRPGSGLEGRSSISPSARSRKASPSTLAFPLQQAFSRAA